MHQNILGLLLANALLGQQHLVVPGSQQSADGNSSFWVSGTVAADRQQTLIDASLTQAMIGSTIQKLAFRRDATQVAFAGGQAMVTVRMSHAARWGSRASPSFASNHGSDLTTVFQGTVILPSSPPQSGSVPWQAATMLEIQLQVPFVYQGGALALDISGTPLPGAPSWWPADAVWQWGNGTAQSIGDGCGPYGGLHGEWSHVSDGGNVPGGTMDFYAFGPPGQIAVWILAASAQANAFDLSPFGMQGCRAHVVGPMASQLTLFAPQPFVPQVPGEGAMARIALTIPGGSNFVGITLASQWLHLGGSGIGGSNAHQWSTSAITSPIGLTLVHADASNGEPTAGRVVPDCGHVIRFEFL